MVVLLVAFGRVHFLVQMFRRHFMLFLGTMGVRFHVHFMAVFQMPFLVGVATGVATGVTRVFRGLFPRVRMLAVRIVTRFDFMFDGMMFQMLFRRMGMTRMVLFLRFHCVKLLMFLGGMRMFVAERLHMLFLRVGGMMRRMFRRMLPAMPRPVLREVFMAAIVQVMTRLVFKFLCHGRRCSPRCKTLCRRSSRL